MNFPKVSFLNKSENITTSIFIKPSEDATVPEKSNITIDPNQIKEILYDKATGNLFIWDNDTSELLWKGIIPTKSQKIIDIYPEEKKIMFGNIEIPSNFETTTKLPTSTKPFSKLYYLGVLAIIIILVIYLIRKMKKNK